MNDILSSISTIKNFMGNAGRNTCNDYLYTALEDAIESMEYRVPKKCVKDSCPYHTHYKCPSCGQIQKSTYAHGFPRLGRTTKYCENCGQALIDENLEGMEDERD